jgi:hypothetical protein
MDEKAVVGMSYGVFIYAIKQTPFPHQVQSYSMSETHPNI